MTAGLALIGAVAGLGLPRVTRTRPLQAAEATS